MHIGIWRNLPFLKIKNKPPRIVWVACGSTATPPPLPHCQPPLGRPGTVSGVVLPWPKSWFVGSIFGYQVWWDGIMKILMVYQEIGIRIRFTYNTYRAREIHPVNGCPTYKSSDRTWGWSFIPWSQVWYTVSVMNYRILQPNSGKFLIFHEFP